MHEKHGSASFEAYRIGTHNQSAHGLAVVFVASSDRAVQRINEYSDALGAVALRGFSDEINQREYIGRISQVDRTWRQTQRNVRWYPRVLACGDEAIFGRDRPLERGIDNQSTWLRGVTDPGEPGSQFHR